MSKAGRPSQIARSKMADSNGTGTPDVGPDIEWDPDNPPMVHECSFSAEFHKDDCDESCPDVPMDELDVKLVNERRAWIRAGMNILSIPNGFADQVHMPGMPIDMFDFEAKLMGLIAAIQETFTIDEETLNRCYREYQLKKLTKTREANEAMIREARTARALGLQPKRLLGPHGEQL